MENLNFNEFLKNKEEQEKIKQENRPKTPALLTQSFEKLFDDIISSLVDDNLVQLRLISFIKTGIETSYLMGLSDGQKVANDSLVEIDKILDGIRKYLEIVDTNDKSS